MSSLSPLDHISYCRFLTKVDGQTWSQDHWRARDIVRAVKGETFGGSVSLNVGGMNRTLDKDHPEVAFEWFVDRVKTETGFPLRVPYFLCPIPDSECTESSDRPPKTMRLAIALAKAMPKLTPWDGLRFLKKMPKTSKTNMRDEDILCDSILAFPEVPDGHIILLDDVCTSGAHARAAARELLRSGAKSVSSMSVARTMLNPDEKVFGYREDKLARRL